MLRGDQMEDAARQMRSSDKFSIKDVQEWLAVFSGDAPGNWSIAATRLIWREKVFGRIRIRSDGYYEAVREYDTNKDK